MVVRQTTQTKTDWDFLNVPKEVSSILEAAPNVVVATSTEQLAQMAISKTNAAGFHEVAYDVPGKGRVVESYVSKVRNGILVNCPEPYMRRRDPECTYIGDELPTDKVRFKDKFKKDFESVRQDTFEWLKKQELCVFPITPPSLGQGFRDGEGKIRAAFLGLLGQGRGAFLFVVSASINSDSPSCSIK
jgi:hypothetical protein